MLFNSDVDLYAEPEGGLMKKIAVLDLYMDLIISEIMLIISGALITVYITSQNPPMDINIYISLSILICMICSQYFLAEFAKHYVILKIQKGELCLNSS